MNRLRQRIAGFARRFGAAGPFAPPLLLALLLAAVFSVSRAALVALHWERIREVERWALVFPVGWRIDSIQICYVVALPVVLLLALPDRTVRRIGKPFAAFLTAMLVAAVFLEVSTFPFLEQFDSRPNRLFVDYLRYPRELVTMLLSGFRLALFGATVALAATAWAGWTAFSASLAALRPWPVRRRLAALAVSVPVLFLGARGTLAHRPANISTAAFSNDHLANQLALDSSYSLVYALYSLKHEENPGALYGKMSDEEILRRVRRVSGIPEESVASEDLPTLHRGSSRFPRERPPNLVIFLQESLDAAYSGALGGVGVTPELDRLGAEGMFLTNLYATGTRTVRGIEAVVSGYPPAPSASIVRLDGSQTGFFTLADPLRRLGYHTEFLYGGESHFDNMRSFLLGNGFEEIHDSPGFRDVEFRGTWGVSDGDLVRKANEVFRSHGDRPFFALMLSTSNHTPFEFPDGHIELFEQPKATVRNTVKYADWAIGELFRLARKEAYFENTIFLVVADHCARVFGSDMLPVERFHIPGVILGPGVPRGRFPQLASQIDLGPTLLGLLGVESEHPMIGFDLLSLPPGHPGRTLMQQDQNHAYRVGDRVVIHQPHAPAQQFTYRDGKLVPEPVDEELERDALAHALLPALLYRKRSYRMADEGSGQAN